MKLKSSTSDDDQPVLSSTLQYSLETGRNIFASCSRVYGTEERIKLDDRDDSLFYEQSRMGPHVDAGFQQQLAGLYQAKLQPYLPAPSLLDLCSSLQSHLPPPLHPPPAPAASPPPHPPTPPAARVLGHGMNAEELAANPALSSWFVQDLNRRTRLDLPSCSFDAVLCCCGVQYLQWPEEVFAEAFRVLKAQGVFVVSFSSTCWQQKAVAGWLTRSAQEQVELVASFMTAAGFEGVTTVLDPPQEGSSDGALSTHSGSSCGGSSSSGSGSGSGATAGQGASDPFYWVVGYRGLGEVQGAPPTPSEMARDFIPPALLELDLQQKGFVSSATLERWQVAYKVLVGEAEELGIPASAIPPLPADADAAAVKQIRDHLQNMIASFLSAGL